jgi:MFS family permease
MFVRWALAEGVSMLGTAVTTVVLPLVVYEATGSAAQTGLLFAMRVVPYLLFGIVAGPIADRGDRRVLIIGGNIAEGVLVATIPLAHAFDALTITHVYVVGLLSATVAVFSDAAVFGAVPALVGPDRLPAANGLLSSLASGCEIAGTVLAGLFVVTVGATVAVWIDAGSFLLAAAVQLGIRSTFRADGPPPEHTTIRAHALRALRFVRGHRAVATLLVVGFGNSFAAGIVLSLVVPYAVEELGLPLEDARIGVMYGAIGVGSLLAGLVLSRLFRVHRVRFLSPTTIGVSGVLALLLAVNRGWVVATALVLLFSVSMSITILVGITYRQLVAPRDLTSSVNVIGRMIAWGGQPFGAAVGAVVASVWDVQVAYAVAAASMLATGSGAAVALRGDVVGPALPVTAVAGDAS